MFTIKFVKQGRTLSEQISTNNQGVLGEQIGNQTPLDTLQKLYELGKEAKESLPKDHPFYEDICEAQVPYRNDLDSLIRERRGQER
jgi:hypothetical protein